MMDPESNGDRNNCHGSHGHRPEHGDQRKRGRSSCLQQQEQQHQQQSVADGATNIQGQRRRGWTVTWYLQYHDGDLEIDQDEGVTKNSKLDPGLSCTGQAAKSVRTGQDTPARSIRAVLCAHAPSFVCLTGSGSIRCLQAGAITSTITTSSSSSTSLDNPTSQALQNFPSVHGFELHPATDNLYQHRAPFVPSGAVHFESPLGFASHTTLYLPAACIVQVESDAAVTTTTTINQEGVHVVNESEVTTYAGSSFSIRCAQSDPLAYPTVIPISWVTSAQTILDDYRHYQRTYHGEQRSPCYRDISSSKDVVAGCTSKVQQLSSHPNSSSSTASTDSFQVVVTGGKGVGKSTCLRYLLHRFLSATTPASSSSSTTTTTTPTTATMSCKGDSNTNHCAGYGNDQNASTLSFTTPTEETIQLCPAVAVLDADPGQPEMGPPGMLTLRVLTKPLLEPPYRTALRILQTIDNDDDDDGDSNKHTNTCQSMIQSHWFGSVVLQSDPIGFMSCLDSLMNTYYQWLSSPRTAHGSLWHPQSVQTIPLLVNMNGWVQGLGFQVLEAALHQILQPRHVIQIAGERRAHIFHLDEGGRWYHQSDPLTDPNVVGGDDSIHIGQATAMKTVGPKIHVCASYLHCATSIPKTKHCDDDDDDGMGDVTTATHDRVFVPGDVGALSPSPRTSLMTTTATTTTTSMMPMTVGNLSARPYPLDEMVLSAEQHRVLRLIYYFDPNIHRNRFVDPRTMLGWNVDSGGDYDCQIALDLAAQCPYAVPLEAVQVQFIREEDRRAIVNESAILDALNGSIVGLCCNNQVMDEKVKQESLLLLSSCVVESIPHCFGLGIVRAIDREQRMMFILTPVPERILPRVDLLVLGSIPVPLECLFRGVYAEAFPFQSMDDASRSKQVLGADPMKSRNNIPRRNGPMPTTDYSYYTNPSHAT